MPLCWCQWNFAVISYYRVEHGTAMAMETWTWMLKKAYMNDKAIAGFEYKFGIFFCWAMTLCRWNWRQRLRWMAIAIRFSSETIWSNNQQSISRHPNANWNMQNRFVSNPLLADCGQKLNMTSFDVRKRRGRFHSESEKIITHKTIYGNFIFVESRRQCRKR